MASQKKKLLIGGQAVIEGVMMKGPSHMAIAIRKPDGAIDVHTERVKSTEDRHPVLNWPFIRGVVTLGVTFVLGYKALTYSVNASLGEEEGDLGWKETAFTMVFALVFALVLFKLLPLLAAEWLSNRFAIVSEHYLLYNLIDGVVKMSFFLIYIILIGRLPDIRDVFRYHGAEHKTVNCFEAGKPLNVENARTCSVEHPRCGTTFVILVLLLSVFVYLFIPSSLSLLGKYALRIALLPVIAGISYEIIRLGTRYWRYKGVRAILAPGIAVQHLTTIEPHDHQLEVSIAALNAVLELEKG